ncbi:hypothetical protein CFC21_051200 [Triticum aestivum]|uniref:Uncharacterized protein n=2 Tax=Triticum aestivum TaxID=4565 RepID=A0A9R1G6L6_WHEAT|nr:uncharacterized protein LOC119284764 [Triticum dicoccoides]XP_044360163.1 uncharacterized protein LOC123081676 [Triticum aestivum]KAF7041397.1 hypothetical protein CFC21_051198 [Triticum aestivum]KAF7041399.1 hypothetical protein CFC21_051200 [Triticum aestivum]
MGNCQAADAAAVVIQHPASGRTELAYWSLPAGEVMAANPGHYVAAVITAPHAASSEGPGGAPPVKHLKLLRPDDTLLLGRVYRLVSFEEVLKEFATKRHVKLSRVMVKAKDEVAAPTKPAKPRRRRGSSGGGGADAGVVREESDRSLAKIMRQSVEEEEAAAAPSSGRVPKAGTNDNNGVAASEPGLDDDDDDCDLESLLPPGLALGRRLGRQWRPALQSIAEGRD